MSPSCNRARSLVSASLDEPLSELEGRFLCAHTARCAACSAFAEDTAAFTEILRTASLEHVPWPASAPLRLPRRRLRVRAVAQLASAASVVVAAMTLAVTADPPGGVTERALITVPGSLPLADESIRSLRRDAIADGEIQILPVSSTSGAPVKPALPAVN